MKVVGRSFKTRLISVVFCLVAFGCARQNPFDSSRRFWEREGWAYIETFGDVFPDAVEVAYMKSDTARTIRAFANDGVHRHEKEFDQSDYVYLVVTMQNERDQAYSVVFKKEKMK